MLVNVYRSSHEIYSSLTTITSLIIYLREWCSFTLYISDKYIDRNRRLRISLIFQTGLKQKQQPVKSGIVIHQVCLKNHCWFSETTLPWTRRNGKFVDINVSTCDTSHIDSDASPDIWSYHVAYYCIGHYTRVIRPIWQRSTDQQTTQWAI